MHIISTIKPTRLAASDMQYVQAHIASHEPVLNTSGKVLPVCWPDLSGNELHYVEECMRSGWISSLGPYVKRFEETFAAYCGVSHAVTVTNGTHALQLALATLGIGPGDEVIIPTFTMIATANAVRYLGATPVFVDARKDTWNIDETRIESAITPRTKAIIVVHIYGHPCEMDTIMALADQYNLWVIEDAAEAHGSLYKGKKVGSIGHIGCFSLYANKMVTCGEGGVVTTNDEKLHSLMYKLHNHAFDDHIHFWHEYMGYNFRLTNLQAALGCAQLERFDHFVEVRRRNAQEYIEFLSSVKGIQFPVELSDVRSTYWMFGILLDKNFGMSRDELRDALAKKGIETRTFFIPMHMQPIYFQKKYKKQFPVADALCKNGLYLPSSSMLTVEDVKYVSDHIRLAAK